MASTLTVFLPVAPQDVPAIDAILHGDPGKWLPGARRTDDGRWLTTLRLGPLRRDVACEVGVLHSVFGSRWLDVSWEPVAQDHDILPLHQALPTFRGQVGLHPDQAVMVLTGTYDVPGGRLGEVADDWLLRGGARQTATRLLVDIVGRAAGELVPS